MSHRKSNISRAGNVLINIVNQRFLPDIDNEKPKSGKPGSCRESGFLAEDSIDRRTILFCVL
jgi:hypothetical protein